MFFHLVLVGLKVSVPKSIHVKLKKESVGSASINNNISGVLVSKIEEEEYCSRLWASEGDAITSPWTWPGVDGLCV